MKTMRRNIAALVLGGGLALAGLAFGQETTTTTTYGTVSDFSPAAITVHTTSSATPVSYTFTKTTTYVDENGNPVSSEVIRSGAPVTVYYTQNGDRMIASKVVVQKVEAPVTGQVIEQKKTTTTTTTSP